MSNGKHDTKRIDLTKFRGMSVASFRVRVTNGQDTIDAAARCLPTDGAPVDPQLFGIQMRQQILAGAIVEVDDKPVTGAYQPSVTWCSRTRELLGKTYDYLNGISEKENDVFQAMLDSDESPRPSGHGRSSEG